MENNELHFNISTGLKNIIGRELITDKIIAIFELVKNSYDAGASEVTITFNNIYSENANIVVSDNGIGMDYNDIKDKWLFIAYSEKKSNRKNIKYERIYAGAKGIGRFSCDRLGSKLELFSIKKDTYLGNKIIIDWDDFEQDSQEDFSSIKVIGEEISKLPSKYKYGTSILINNLRDKWDSNSIIELKKSLVKFINPFEINEDKFDIYIECEDEKESDTKKTDIKETINGKVENYIFEALNIKTTQISVQVSEDGHIVKTILQDRGIFLFEVEQKNIYRNLKNIKVQLFYLNKPAKIEFKKIMGIRAVEFGSIFVYKNGFRIMPYGEKGSDVFNIDKRKQQGYGRNIGTRELMGRLVILGDNPDFVETSSRDGGFIKTAAYDELIEFFRLNVLIPLGKYVVDLIKWGHSINYEDVLDEINDEIIDFIINPSRNGNIISKLINPNLADMIDEKRDKSDDNNIDILKNIANESNNEEAIKAAEELRLESERKEREAKRLQKAIDLASKEMTETKKELEITINENLFYRNAINPRTENIIEALHLINPYTETIRLNAESVISEISELRDKKIKDNINESLLDIIESVNKINSINSIAFSANYNVNNENVDVNIYDFLNQFINNVFLPKVKARNYEINVKLESDNIAYTRNINQFDFIMLIENIIINSCKANSKNLYISIKSTNDDIVISFKDDGVGLNKYISNANRIFELGFTTTNGSGIGLSHAKRIVDNMGGNISVNTDYVDGFELIVRLSK